MTSFDEAKNALERIEYALSSPDAEVPETWEPEPDIAQLVRVARAAQAIDLRESDLPIGVTRSRVQALHAELVPLLEEAE